MKNWRGLSMHQSISSNHFCAKHLPDTLMPETNTEDGSMRPELANQLIADSCVIRSSRPGRDTNFGRTQLFDFTKGRLVVSSDYQFRPKFAEILHQIVRKRIVIIDNKDHKSS